MFRIIIISIPSKQAGEFGAHSTKTQYEFLNSTSAVSEHQTPEIGIIICSILPFWLGLYARVSLAKASLSSGRNIWDQSIVSSMRLSLISPPTLRLPWSLLLVYFCLHFWIPSKQAVDAESLGLIQLDFLYLIGAVSNYQNPKIGIFSSLPLGLLINTACSSSSVKASLSNWRIHSRAKTSFAQCGSLWFRHCVWSFSSFSAFSSFSCIFRHGFASIQSSSDPVEIRCC